MEGKPNPPDSRGLIPSAFQQIYDHVALANVNQNEKYLVRASYFEIYNEEIRDLLFSPSNKKNNNNPHSLELKESPDSGVYVKDLSSVAVKSVAEIDALLQMGKKNRSVAMTNMNAESSRSHSVFTVVIECSFMDERGEEHIRVGKLNLVDLAGSERQSKTLATGDRLREATNINLSLSALGNVISALVDGKSQHIPYRDSKLTRILQDSLGGNTRTVMCANVGPADYNYNETLSTLRYANRAKNIKNKPVINEDPKDAVLREFQEEIARLKAQLAQMPSNAIPSSELPHNLANEHILNGLKERMSRETTMAEGRSKVEMEQLRQEKDQTAEERRILQVKLEKERLNRAEVDQQRILLEKKLSEMENKFILGGQVADKTAMHEAALRKAELDLIARRENELALSRQMSEQVESQLELEEKYTSLNDEVQAKTRKLKKYWEKLRQAKSDIKDLQAEFQIERDEMLESIRNLNKQLKLKELIISQFLPPEAMSRFGDIADGGRASWNEDEEMWVIPRNFPAEAKTRLGDIVTGERAALSSPRPETEYSRAQRLKDPTGVRFRFQNVIDLELNASECAVQEISGSGLVSKTVTDILRMKIGDGSLHKIHADRDFPITRYLRYSVERSTLK
mmetsp:Transcript_26683/g.38260  ORF Transcript_26683/g.38260 Transcript_26683/m.38260 type:complete len:627 (-) Transcript_26683:262-2142(-)|eukprot:CAMPEP_0172433106 /NCGR_PEP_ID=MMETSP1064-20121228/66555_1 /TAXON_ID=202472 /ORGANISM="Aulacoseira subarctica , Strain CCAP 1002/5" /LENGTH=626 /DNA_ID=CAMNT_0013180839 /DNA_START=340 /DNA_END=2220 /DNA_ORIENTATION=-